MANDKHKAAREAREAWDRKLWEKWQREHVVTPPVEISPIPLPPLESRDWLMLEVTKLENERTEPRRTPEDRKPAKRERFPIGFLPRGTASYDSVLYSNGDVERCEASPWDLAEARFAESQIAALRDMEENECVCFGEGDGNCGVGHGGMCAKPPAVNVAQHGMYIGDHILFPTCLDCAHCMVDRDGFLVLDFLDEPPKAATFEYLRAQRDKADEDDIADIIDDMDKDEEED